MGRRFRQADAVRGKPDGDVGRVLFAERARGKFPNRRGNPHPGAERDPAVCPRFVAFGLKTPALPARDGTDAAACFVHSSP